MSSILTVGRKLSPLWLILDKAQSLVQLSLTADSCEEAVSRLLNEGASTREHRNAG